MRAESELVAHCAGEDEERGFLGGEGCEVGFEGHCGRVFHEDVVEEGAVLDGGEHGGVNSVCVNIKFGTRLAAEVESSWTRTGPGILRAVRAVCGFEVRRAIEAF